MRIPVSVCGFYGIFSDGHIMLSKTYGMAFLYDTKQEAKSQMRELRKFHPDTPMYVAVCNLYLPDGNGGK